MLRICFMVLFCQVFCKPLENQGLITFKPHLQNFTDNDGENYVNGDYRWGKETFFERNAKWKLATTTEPPIQDYYSNWVKDKDPKPNYDKNYYNLAVNNRPTLVQVDGKKEGRETELDKQHYHNSYDYNSKKYFDRDYLQYPSHSSPRRPDTSNYFVNDKNYNKKRYDNKVGGNPFYNYNSGSGRGKDKANQLLNYFKNQLVNQYAKGYSDGQEDFYQKRNQCLKLIYNSEY